MKLRLLSVFIFLFFVSVGYSQNNAVYINPNSSIGNNSNPCTATQPCSTIQKGIDEVDPYGTIYLMDGVYYEDKLVISKNGVTITNHDNDNVEITGSILSIKDGLSWTPIRSYLSSNATVQCNGTNYNVDGGITIYSLSYPDLNKGNLRGKIKANNGDQITLINYDKLESLITKEEAFQSNYYAGPGFYYCSSGILYIRLDLPDVNVVGSEINDYLPVNWVTDPDDLGTMVTANNPEGYHLLIGDRKYGFVIDEDTRDVEISNLNFNTFSRNAILLKNGANNIDIINNEIIVNNYGIEIGEGNEGTGCNCTNQLNTNQNINHDITISENRIIGFHPEWAAWHDFKRGKKITRTAQLAGISIEGGWRDSEVSNNCISDLFDGILDLQPNYYMDGNTLKSDLISHDITILSNQMDRIYDDALQLGTATYNYEFAYNYIIGVGPAHHGTGASQFPATKYIHHNIIDKMKQFWKRPCSSNANIDDCKLTTSQTDKNFAYNALRYKSYQPFWNYHRPIEEHSGKKYTVFDPTTNTSTRYDCYIKTFDPWKIYHNTIIFGKYGYSTLASASGAGENAFNARFSSLGSQPHEVYNNIFLLENDDPNDIAYISRQVYLETSIGEEASIYNGNVWWKDVTTSNGYKYFFSNWKENVGTPQPVSTSSISEIVLESGCDKSIYDRTSDVIDFGYKISSPNLVDLNSVIFKDQNIPSNSVFSPSLSDFPSSYKTDWENSGLVANPGLNVNYEPTNTNITQASFVTTNPVVLSNNIPNDYLPQNYTSLNNNYRGAIPYSDHGINVEIPVGSSCLSNYMPTVKKQRISKLELNVSPNPFTDYVNITFNIPSISNAKCMIYNHIGELVQILHSDKRSKGDYQFVWNGSNSNGMPLASGMYIIVLQTDNDIISKKVILQK